jgi:hypothetical protein
MTDDETTVGEEYPVTADISNIGGAQATQTITLDVDGTTEDSTDVSLTGQSSGTPDVQSVTLSFTPSSTGTKTVTVASDNDSESITLDVRSAGAVILPTIQSTTSPVAPGETVQVNAEIANTSAVVGSTGVALDVAGVGVVDSRAEFLTAGETRTLTLDWDVPPDQTQQAYTATVVTDDGSDATTVTVGGEFLLTLDSLTFVQPATFDVAVASTTSPVAPGDTLDVTVDVTNTGDETGTQTVALDIDNGVGQVDSQSVTLSGGGSATKTLSWSVPSGQTEQDYQATVASADDTASQTVTVSTRPSSVVLQYSPTTFSTGDSTWVDDTGTADMSMSGNLQKTTYADGTGAVGGDGSDDYGSVLLPSGLEGTGLQNFAIETRYQSTETDNSRLIGVSDGSGGAANRLLLSAGQAIDSNGDFVLAQGNMTFELFDTNGNRLTAGPASNPGLQDGNKHTVLVNVVDSTTSNLEIIIDGSTQPLNYRYQEDPSSFGTWATETAHWAWDDNGLRGYADAKLGPVRWHDTDVTPTL